MLDYLECSTFIPQPEFFFFLDYLECSSIIQSQLFVFDHLERASIVQHSRL